LTSLKILTLFSSICTMQLCSRYSWCCFFGVYGTSVSAKLFQGIWVSTDFSTFHWFSTLS